MGLKLDIKRKLSNRSERVKAVDFHPSEPWLLAGLYNGNVYIYNYETQGLLSTFEMSDLPVRASKFIARKSWLVAGSDDMMIRVFNYNTHEKVTGFEAHSDYIRSVAIHPTAPLILTASDDMLIKAWDWEKGWKNIMTFEGHSHYVMQVSINPKDTNTFASASLDKTIKVWSLGSSHPNYTLEGHEKGVNCVDYYYGGDKPFLISGADDKSIKVWDYQNKSCVQTLEGHSNNVTVICFHPELPIIISGSEDGTIRIWHANTYRLENTLNYGMERVWALGYIKGSNDIAFGYDEGTISIKLGREEPAISMDNSGKIIWAKHSEIQTSNVKSSAEETINDGERISLPVKDLGSCEIYPSTLLHSPNGRFVVVCGDGEYIIYTALAWRNKSFGNALDFVWALDSNEYAIRESSSKVRIFKSFKEKNVEIRFSFSSEAIHGGALLGIRSSGFLTFFDWETGSCVRRIDVVAKNVFWSESDLVVIACEESFYVLKFNRLALQAALDRSGGFLPEGEGVEDALEVVSEINEVVKTGKWVGDCFIYTTSINRLNYIVGGQVSTIYHFDSPMYVLGYIARDNRIYLSDKDINVVSFSLPLTLVEYQTAVLRGDLEAADSILPSISVDQRERVARFLEGQGLLEQSLAVSNDSEHRFDLSIKLEKLNIAYEIAEQLNQEEKWKIVGSKALEKWQYNLAESCMKNSKDYEGLLIFYQAQGNRQALLELSNLAEIDGKNNIAFTGFLILGEIEKCLDLLCRTQRIPEAALLARTYAPSQVPRLVNQWKQLLFEQKMNKNAEMISDPFHNPEMFPDFKYALFAEEVFKKRHGKPTSASEYAEWKDSLEWNIVAQLKKNYPDGPPSPTNVGSEHPSPKKLGSEHPSPKKVGSGSPSKTGSPSKSGSRPPSPTKSGRTPSVRSNSPERSFAKVDDEGSETMSFISMEGHGPGGSTIAASSVMGDEFVHANIEE